MFPLSCTFLQDAPKYYLYVLHHPHSTQQVSQHQTFHYHMPCVYIIQFGNQYNRLPNFLPLKEDVLPIFLHTLLVFHLRVCMLLYPMHNRKQLVQICLKVVFHTLLASALSVHVHRKHYYQPQLSNQQ